MTTPPVFSGESNLQEASEPMALGIIKFGARISQARLAANLSQQALADRIGVSQPSLSEWERDISKPSVESMALLAHVLGVSFEWLAMARGGMRYCPGETSQFDAGSMVAVPTEYQNLLLLYQKLSYAKRQAVIQFLDAITS